MASESPGVTGDKKVFRERGQCLFTSIIDSQNAFGNCINKKEGREQ